MIDEQRLQRDMLQAHEQDDVAALPPLYLAAARLRESQGDIDAACFFYTHAYVYALDCGNREIADTARSQLKSHGRDR
ncbi:hypothetical protein [Anderseniella sp. Alg231-50]|uniref:hypothetical protein n=1 Tax=Anderseniella sp. Alg231-50 TaxID=1922226 RepID=UPI00307B88F4